MTRKRARPRLSLTLLPLALDNLAAKAKKAGSSMSQVIEAWLLGTSPKKRGQLAAKPKPKPKPAKRVRAPKSGVRARTAAAAQVAASRSSTLPSNVGLFAGVVRTAADRSRRKFGHKTFIRGVEEELRGLGFQFNRSELDRKLIEARRSGDLLLTRADLVNAMNPDDVRLSEVRDGNSVFHFFNPEVPTR